MIGNTCPRANGGSGLAARLATCRERCPVAPLMPASRSHRPARSRAPWPPGWR